VQQLSVDHNTSNEEELRRLEHCGLDPNALRHAKRLGTQQNTRSIGDYSIKGGYVNVDVIRLAPQECRMGESEGGVEWVKGVCGRGEGRGWGWRGVEGGRGWGG
jgi:TAK1-binding protein 1